VSFVIPAEAGIHVSLVIPAKAGIHVIDFRVRCQHKAGRQQMDSRFRGNDVYGALLGNDALFASPQPPAPSPLRSPSKNPLRAI
jgi:hypothetical protein